MNKPKYTVSIVGVRAGETIPETFLHKLLSENRSAVGFVVHEPNSLVVEKFDEMKDTVEEDVKEFSGILANTKAFPRMFVFHSFPEDFDPDEIQPWIAIKDSKGNPILVVAADGDFPGRGAESFSEFYGLMHEYLGPKIESTYKLLGNDPEKLYAYLRSDDFQDVDLKNVYSHRAAFAFMPSTGDPFVRGKNEIGGEFSWGVASNIYGYTETAIESATPAKAEEPRRRSKYSSDEPAAPAAPPKPEVQVPKADPPKADPIAAAADKTAKGHYEDVPRNLHGKKKKAYIRGLMNDSLPVDWDNMTRVWVEHETVVKSLQELPKLADPKDMIHTVGATTIKDVKVVPVISGPQQAAALEFIKTHLDSSSNKISNPLEAQKEEARYPVFSELMKAKMPAGLDDAEQWPITAVLSFIKTNPEVAWLMMIEYRRDRINRKMHDKPLKELVGTLPADPVVVPAAKPATDTPASPAAPAAEPQVRKSKYA